MWLSKLFKKEAPTKGGLEWLQTDMHSHLIPGIDDGSPNVEASIQLIRGLMDLGYKKVITTPHILWDMYPNTPEKINGGLELVRQRLKEEGIDFEIHAAAEYFIDEHFVNHLVAKQPLLTLKANLVLVEISTVTAPLDFREVLFELQMQDYKPVIAHPERYIYLKNNRDIFEDLKLSGCLLQLNLLSLVGHYGVAIQQLAEFLIKQGFYDFAGTDLHHVNHLPLIAKAASSPLLATLREQGVLKNARL